MNKLKTNKIILLGCVSLVIMLFIGGNKHGIINKDKAVPEFIFRYAENQSADYPTTLGAYYFADLVREKTNGKVEIKVYYSEQLGDQNAAIEQLQIGSIDFARVSLSPLAEISGSLNLLQLPYLYRDDEHMWKVLDNDIGDRFLSTLDGSGLVGLSWYGAGARSFYTSKVEIKSLEDLKGLNIRVQESSLMMDMIKALGANPTPMPFGEVYYGLQAGIVDGAENNWPSYESTLHYQVAKYFFLDEHTRVPEIQLMSQKTLDRLPENYVEIIRECAIESAKFEREEWAKREKLSEMRVIQHGVIAVSISHEEITKFQQACKPLYEKYAKDHLDLIDEIINHY